MSDYALRINNRAADAPKRTRQDCVEIAIEAEREIERLRKDAERYRFVRANPAMLLHLKNSEFDAAIDAAMKEQP